MRGRTIFDFFQKLFDTSDFPARWNCGNWTPGHGWLHILSDIGVWSAYVAIPLVLGFFILRRRDLPFRGIFILFGLFILACGTTHLMEAIIFWWPAYRLAGLFKLCAALISWATVFALVPTAPKALAMRTPQELQREIDQRRKIEAQLKLKADELSIKNSQLAEAERLKSEFLANMSHEIRTPMNGVIGITDLLLDMELTDEQRKYMLLVKFSADSLLTVINDILDFSKIEARKLDLDHAIFDLRDCVGDTIRTLAIKAEQKGLELIFEVDADVPNVLTGDPGRLRQILNNLIGNAIKFTDQGEVVLSVRCESATDKVVRLEFAVKDTGIGIPIDKQQLIFDAFMQADASTTRKFGGTGLGLGISRRLVELMGGKIWLESDPSKGTVFHFTGEFEISTMPISREVPGLPEILHNKRALIVDDNLTNRTVLEKLLLTWGMSVQAVASAAEAIEILTNGDHANEQPDILVLDAVMPVVDGFTFAEEIRKDSRFDGLPIIMLSSAGQRGDANRCRSLGINAYLTKPVKHSELLECVLIAASTDPRPEKVATITRHELRQKRGARVLVAEDNSINQKLMIGLLSRRGYAIQLASNGREALELTERGNFDVLLMDVQMPEMDGLQATAAIREREKKTGTHLPIIGVTALAMVGDRDRCMAAGMDGYVTKPLKADALFREIDRITALSNAEATGSSDREKGLAALPRKTSESTLRSEKGESTEGSQIFDRADALLRVQGDRQLLREMVVEFVNMIPALKIDGARFIEKSDGVALERLTHKLVGMAGVFGAHRVVARARRISEMAAKNSLEGIAESFGLLCNDLDDLADEMIRFAHGDSE